MTLPHPRRRPLTTLLTLAASAALLTAVSGPALASASADASATTVLGGEVLKNLASFPVISSVSGSSKMRVAVAVQDKTAAIDAAYAAMTNPVSPAYGKSYTLTQYDERFGVSPLLAKSVTDAVTAHGLAVAYSAPDSSYIELTGTAKQVEDTFQVAENTYRTPAGGSFFANAQAPTVPSGVVALAGLTDLTDKHVADLTTRVPSQTSCSATTGPRDECKGTLTAADLWSIYNQPASDQGEGQKVGIFGEGTLDDVVSDLRQFETDTTGTKPNLKQKRTLPDGSAFPIVPVRRVLVGDDLTDSAGSGEWDLDSDAVTGMAPKLQELSYYFGSDLSDASIGGTYAAWANETDGPLIGNSSFGGPEQLEYLSGFILDIVLQKAAMLGKTMFVSSGDGGGSCLPGLNGVVNAAVPCVEYPASSPYVVGVGGTVLFSTATGSVQNTPAARSVEYSWTFSGGGQSEVEPAPSYQSADFPASVAVPCVYGGSMGKPCRGVPDVSSVSGDVTSNGYEVVSGNAETESGGTSLSSPLWAGMYARILGAHASSCSNSYAKSVIGFAQPVLYAVAAGGGTSDTESFFDVTAGGVYSVSTPGLGNEQQITIPRTSVLDPTGYDYVSGLGTPNVSNLIKYIDCGSYTPVAATTDRAADTTVIPTRAGCGDNGILAPVDPPGDEFPATDTAADIRNVTISSDLVAKTTTFAASVTDLGTTGVPATGTDYAFEFKYNNVGYAVTADRGPDTFALQKRNLLDVEVENAEEPPTTLSSALTGSFDATTDTVSIVMPWSVFNMAAAPAIAYGPGSQLISPIVYTNSGTAAAALPGDYQGVLIDQAEYYTCFYVVPGDVAAALPESPLAALLPIVALAGGAAVLVRRRRRAA